VLGYKMPGGRTNQIRIDIDRGVLKIAAQLLNKNSAALGNNR
jgi:hypothetical protein